jgi:hypothetical protein
VKTCEATTAVPGKDGGRLVLDLSGRYVTVWVVLPTKEGSPDYRVGVDVAVDDLMVAVAAICKDPVDNCPF